MANLVPDPFFDAFTRPMINKNFEAKTCGEGPDLGKVEHFAITSRIMRIPMEHIESIGSFEPMLF